MRFRYRVSLEDQLAFTRYHLKHSPRARRNRQKGLYLIPPVLAALALIAWLTFPGLWWLAAGLFVLAGLYVIGYPFLYNYVVLREVRRRGEEDPEGRFERVQEMGITPEGLVIPTPQGPGLIEWARLHEVVIAEHHIYIYVNEVNSLIVPEDKIEDQPFEQVAAALQDHIRRKADGQTPVTSE